VSAVHVLFETANSAVGFTAMIFSLRAGGVGWALVLVMVTV
jgi:hypothetical protein